MDILTTAQLHQAQTAAWDDVDEVLWLDDWDAVEPDEPEVMLPLAVRESDRCLLGGGCPTHDYQRTEEEPVDADERPAGGLPYLRPGFYLVEGLPDRRLRRYVIEDEDYE